MGRGRRRQRVWKRFAEFIFHPPPPPPVPPKQQQHTEMSARSPYALLALLLMAAVVSHAKLHSGPESDSDDGATGAAAGAAAAASAQRRHSTTTTTAPPAPPRLLSVIPISAYVPQEFQGVSFKNPNFTYVAGELKVKRAGNEGKTFKAHGGRSFNVNHILSNFFGHRYPTRQCDWHAFCELFVPVCVCRRQCG